jgi:hypothetical protein
MTCSSLIGLVIASLLGITGSLPAHAQNQPSFKAISKAQGAPFDLTATETARLPTKSYLDVPGFHERSAPGTRWLMCVYSALAAERSFTHWFAVYPANNSTRVVVGFTNSGNAKPKDILGTDYVQKNVLGDSPMPVTKMADFCGSLAQYKS